MFTEPCPPHKPMMDRLRLAHVYGHWRPAAAFFALWAGWFAVCAASTDDSAGPTANQAVILWSSSTMPAESSTLPVELHDEISQATTPRVASNTTAADIFGPQMYRLPALDHVEERPTASDEANQIGPIGETFGSQPPQNTEVVDILWPAAPPPPPELTPVARAATPIAAPFAKPASEPICSELTDGRSQEQSANDSWFLEPPPASVPPASVPLASAPHVSVPPASVPSTSEAPAAVSSASELPAPEATGPESTNLPPFRSAPVLGLEEQATPAAEPPMIFSPTFPNTPSVAQISERVVPAVRKAYWLAGRGALHAARTEFIEILRRIAQAKDAEFGTSAHARSLARGLRTLDEADDFVPIGVQLEADLDVQTICCSHRTPVLAETTRAVLPHEAVAIYHAYAQQELGRAVGGEPAGSMVLCGLGKIYSHLADRNDGDLQSIRKGMTMHQAALIAHSDNHLAANELGVLLAQAGHDREALDLFLKVVQMAPHSTAYRNLSAVQHRLGQAEQAAFSQQEAERLAQWERTTGAVSKRMGIHWIPPSELARIGQPPEMPPAHQVVASGPTQRPSGPRPTTGIQHTGNGPHRSSAQGGPGLPPQRPGESQANRREGHRWPWQRVIEVARSATSTRQSAVGSATGQPAETFGNPPPDNLRMDPVPSRTIWR